MRWPWQKKAIPSTTQPFYVITDGENHAQVFGQMFFKRPCAIVALFVSEQDALETLYAIETSGAEDVPPLKVTPLAMLARKV